MARYSSFLGRRVEVQYRASDTLLPASGVFVADSGRSIFLEQSFEQRGQHRYFRWEIPYQCLIRITATKAEESPAATIDQVAGPAEQPASSETASSENASSETAPSDGPSLSGKLASNAAAGD